MSYRLEQVVIEGFRGYGRRQEISCGGDAVLLVGPNGSGKTSFFDAISWCLFGRIKRLLGSRDAIGEELIRNRFLPSMEPNVSLTLTNSDGAVVIARDTGGLQVISEFGELVGTEANAWVSRLVGGPWPRDEDPTANPQDDAETMFLRCSHLSQDDMAAFLREATPRERFDTLSGLLGLDAVQAFYRHENVVAKELGERLEQERTRERQMEQRLATVRADIESIQSSGTAVRTRLENLLTEYQDLLRDATAAAVDVAPGPEPGDPLALIGAASDLREQLSAAAEAEESRVQEFSDLLALYPSFAQGKTSLAENRPLHERRNQDFQALRANVVSSEQRIQELLSRQEDLRSRQASADQGYRELASFLQMAQRHLQEDQCPVCEQAIDLAEVRQSVERRAATLPEQLRTLTAQLAEAERKLSLARAEHESLNQRSIEAQQELNAVALRVAEEERSIQQFGRRLALLGRSANDQEIEQALTHDRDTTTARSLHVSNLVERAELVRRRANLLVDSERLKKLTQQRTALEADLKRAVSLSQELASAQLQAQGIVRSARRAERDLVERAFQVIQPTLDVLYGRLRPHPVLDNLSLEIGSFDERGEVRFLAKSGSTTANVTNIFSSAQLNAVAVCIFLAMNLNMRGSQLAVALLDDPIQNMDDFNVLGLLDLLRGLARDRQFVISTHDEQIGELIRRKLRPSTEGSQTVTHVFQGYEGTGPTIATTVDNYRPQPAVLKQVVG